MNKITGRELDPNQFPAWAEFTPESEALTKVSARAGFKIDLGNPLALEDLTLASLGVSGLTTLHDLDIKDASETVILQRNGSTIETLIDEGGTPTMARVGAGIIESGYVSGRGWYVKYGDGTMEQWYYAQRGTSGYQTWTFPTPFINTNITVHVTGNNSETESIAGNAGVPTAASCRWNCTRTDTGGYPATAGRTALNATGRWKA